MAKRQKLCDECAARGRTTCSAKKMGSRFCPMNKPVAREVFNTIAEDLPDGAYLAMADELGIDPTEGF